MMSDTVLSIWGPTKDFLHKWRGMSREELKPARTIDWRYLVPLLFFTLFFLHVHGTMPNVPSGEGISGWEGWWDQGHYVKSANALARGNLDPSQHWYPIGYSAMAAPFVWLGMRDPFLIVNLICLLGFVGLFVRYFERVIGFYPAVFAITLGLLLPLEWHNPSTTVLPLLQQFVVPWSNTPVPALYMAILLLCRSLTANDRPWQDIFLGALVGLILSLKFTDALPLIVPGAVYAWQRIWLERNWHMPAYAFSGLLLVLVPFLIVTFSIHGGVSSDYLRISGEIGLSVSDFHERTFQILLGAGAIYDEAGTSLFALQPWLYFAAPLAVVWMLFDWRSGASGMGLALAALSIYIAYNDFWTFNVFRFLLIHYIVWILPFFAAAGIAGFMLLLRRAKFGWIAFLAVVGIVLSSIHYEPRVLPRDSIQIVSLEEVGTALYEINLTKRTEIDAIDFVGATSNDLVMLTQERARISVDGGEPLRFYFDYRIIQVGHGVRLIFRSHVRASKLSIQVGPDVLNKPMEAAQVIPLVFSVRFWGVMKDSALADPLPKDNSTDTAS